MIGQANRPALSFSGYCFQKKMQNALIFSTLIIGLSGIVAQVLILRELLVSFYGNELTLGIILANWVLAEALGVFIIGKLINRIKNKVVLFVFLQVTFSFLLPAAVYLSRTFKGILGIPFALALGLYAVCGISLLVIIPVAFCHGALFSVSTKIYSLCGKNPAQCIGRVYTWETIGTLTGGIILTYLFIPLLNSFQITSIISLVNLLSALFFVRFIVSRRIKYTAFAACIVCIVLFLNVSPGTMQRSSIEKQWQGFGLIVTRNSIYGNIAVTDKEGQKTFFYNGSPIITTPYPDITFAEDFGNLPLLFHPRPKQILVISAGAGGLINEILKYPIERIDYAELDPLIIKMLKVYPSTLTQGEFSDRRLSLVNSDGRKFLYKTANRYDVILIGLSRPSDLTTNRLFTQEFFALAKSKLRPKGILAFWLPGSLTYLSRELRDLNACILNALKRNFGNARVIPGDYNIILASDAADLTEVTPLALSQKLSHLRINTRLLTPAYLDYRMNTRWLDWFNRSSLGATKKINRDLQPFAVFQMLILWNKEFSPKLARALGVLQELNLKLILIALAIVYGLLLLVSRRRPKLPVVYCIVTTGFFGMLTSLLLIFSFQVFYGYLYYMLGLLIAIFMAGIAAGSILITRRISLVRAPLNLLMGFEGGIAIFTLILAWILTRFSGWVSSYWIFTALFFIPGFLMGLEFPLASHLYIGKKGEVGSTAGLLYAADLLGGWVAGILGGIFFLPILGLFNTCLIIVLLKLSSVLMLARAAVLKIL
ncbi:MAG: hypothetical protein WC658_02980 [Candidatus Omnitrophota bacterium]